MTEDSIEGSCHCGAITIRIDTMPEMVTECNCSLCRRIGGLWHYLSPKVGHPLSVIPAKAGIQS